MPNADRWFVAVPQDAQLQVRWAARRLADAAGAEVVTLPVAFPPQAALLRRSEPMPPAPALPTDPEGYALAVEPGGSAVVALADTGLANGLLALERQVRARGVEGVTAAAEAPAFRYRDMYHFQTPWRLHGITTDTYSLTDWKRHIEWVRSIGASRLIVDLWCNQYYHPDIEETHRHEWKWQTLREALRYAQDIGLQTALLLFPCLVPQCLFYDHPELRAPEEGGYWGIHLCWSRARDLLMKVQGCVFEYFGRALDSAAIEYWDPGMCLCSDCWGDFARTGLDIYGALAEAAAEHTRTGRVDVVTLHIDGIASGRWKGNDGQLLAYEDPEAIGRLLDGLPPGTLVCDLHARPLQRAAERGLPTSQFFFELDPESGFESFQLFPRPCLALTERQVTASLEAGHAGIMDYRLAPNLHFPADYVLMRKQWEPELPVDAALAELASGLCELKDARDAFVQSVLLTERWWEERDLDALTEARALAETAAEAAGAAPSDRLRVWADGVRCLATAADFLARGAASDSAVFDEMVQRVRAEMMVSWIYRSLTAHAVWVCRSTEMVAQRLRWWLEAVGEQVNWRE